MNRFRMLAAAAFCLTLFLSFGTKESEARHWSLSARYNSGYFHDYHNYGARYSHRPYSYYHGYYGARTYAGVSPRGYYGGWSTYAPYAYSPSYFSYSSYSAPSIYRVSTYSRYPVVTQTVGYRTVTPPASCNTCGSVETIGATCCGSSVAYSPGCFSGRYRRGLLGPLCPFRRARCNYGTCGSFGYSSSGCGW